LTNDYDAFKVYLPKEWSNSKKWITNRALFLLTMRERKPKVFFAKDMPTPKEQMEAYQKSYGKELHMIASLCPQCYKMAYDRWIHDWDHGKIMYEK